MQANKDIARKITDLIILLGFIVVVAILFIFFLSDGKQCLDNPQAYIIEQFKGHNISCMCIIDGGKYHPLLFGSDSESMRLNTTYNISIVAIP